ncbi:MAG: ferric iron reductase [Patulibacter minatonensis]
MSGGRPTADEAIERVTAMSGGAFWFLVVAGPNEGDDWWTRDRAVAGLDDLFARFPAGDGRSADAVQGSLLLEAWAWTILAPTTAALLGTGIVLDLAAAGTAVQAPPGQRPVFLGIDVTQPWAQAPTVVDPDDPASIDLLLGPMVAHLAPLVAAISERTGRSRTALWRGVRDRLAGTLLWAGEASGRRTVAEAMLERAFGDGRVRGPVPRLVPGEGQPALVRGGCCLWWRAGNDPCDTCPLSHRGEASATASG